MLSWYRSTVKHIASKLTPMFRVNQQSKWRRPQTPHKPWPNLNTWCVFFHIVLKIHPQTMTNYWLSVRQLNIISICSENHFTIWEWGSNLQILHFSVDQSSSLRWTLIKRKNIIYSFNCLRAISWTIKAKHVLSCSSNCQLRLTVNPVAVSLAGNSEPAQLSRWGWYRYLTLGGMLVPKHTNSIVSLFLSYIFFFLQQKFRPTKYRILTINTNIK